jgi:cytochrome P450
MLLKLGEVPVVLISSAEAAALVFKTNDVAFSSRPRSVTLDIFGGGGKDIAFAPYGDRWRQMRKVCVVELLCTKQVRRMEGIRAEEVGNLLGSIAASNGAALNVSKMVAALSADVVTQAVFGGKFAQRDEYLREVDRAVALVSGSSLVDLFPSSRLVRWFSSGERRMRRCYGRIQRIIADIIDERRAARGGTGDDVSRQHKREGPAWRLAQAAAGGLLAIPSNRRGYWRCLVCKYFSF